MTRWKKHSRGSKEQSTQPPDVVRPRKDTLSLHMLDYTAFSNTNISHRQQKIQQLKLNTRQMHLLSLCQQQNKRIGRPESVIRINLNVISTLYP